MSANMGALPSAVMIFLSIICMFISAFRPQVFDNARSGAQYALSPVLSAVSMPFQKASLILRDIYGIAALQATNARLEQENAKLRGWYQVALLKEAENKSLRELLNLKADPADTYITARIISDAGNSYVKSLLVSAGLSEGVDKGQAVLAGEGVVGRIIEANAESSRVLLVTDMNSRVPIMVSDTMQHAIMAGSNTTHPKLIHMPQDSRMSDGAHIVTSGFGGIFPPGIPVGRVVSDKDGTKRVELYSDVGALQFVRIVKHINEENLKLKTSQNADILMQVKSR
jgi:rod shape-determining protein MreC